MQSDGRGALSKSEHPANLLVTVALTTLAFGLLPRGTEAQPAGGPTTSLRQNAEPFSYTRLFQLEEDIEIPVTLLASPGAPFASATGQYLVPERREGRILIYSAEGRYVDHFGRRGEGPGEFQGIEILAADDDRILIYDGSPLNRLNIFTPKGELQSMIPAPKGSPPLSAIYPLKEGGLLLVHRKRHAWEDGNLGFSLWATRLGAGGDTLFSVGSEPVATFYILEERQQENITGYYHYQAYPSLAFIPGEGFIISSGRRPLLRQYDLMGELTQSLEINLVPEAITAADRARVREPYEEFLERTPDAYATKLFLEKMRFSEHKGFWDQVMVDDAGFIWLRVPEETNERRELGGAAYRVLSPSGMLLGQTRWPVVSGHIRNGRLVGLRYESDSGALIPTVYRIEASGVDYP